MVAALGLVLTTEFAMGPGLGGGGGVVAMFSVLAGFHPLSLFVYLLVSNKVISQYRRWKLWLFGYDMI